MRFQECDTVGITRPIVKHNFLVKDVRDMADTLKKAFHIARSLAVGAEVSVRRVAGRDRLSPGRSHRGNDRAGALSARRA